MNRNKIISKGYFQEYRAKLGKIFYRKTPKDSTQLVYVYERSGKLEGMWWFITKRMDDF